MVEKAVEQNTTFSFLLKSAFTKMSLATLSFFAVFLQAPQEMLAQSVLAEIPGQLTGFFNTSSLKPPKSNSDAPPPDIAASAPSL